MERFMEIFKDILWLWKKYFSKSDSSSTSVTDDRNIYYITGDNCKINNFGDNGSIIGLDQKEVSESPNSKEGKPDEERKLLQTRLTAPEQKRANLEKTLEEKKALITDTEQKPEKHQDLFPKKQLTSTKEALEKGDTRQAETLLKKEKETQAGHAAKAAYQLAKLAEDRIDYATARENYIQAAQFEPDNTVYLNAAGLIMHTPGSIRQGH